MKINYKEPYWIKFCWDIEENTSYQYVTEFNKKESKKIMNFIFEKNFIITTKIKIQDDFKRDEIGAIFGKPGKNMGLTYNKTYKMIGFEFWTKGDGDDIFCMVNYPNQMNKKLSNGVILSIEKKDNKIILYENFSKKNELIINYDFIDDYKNSPLYLGCSNLGTEDINHRHHGELEIEYLSIVTNVDDIKKVKKIYETDNCKLIENEYYDDIIFLCDFQTKNNLDIYYDESKNTNFLEKVPKEYIK